MQAPRAAFASHPQLHQYPLQLTHQSPGFAPLEKGWPLSQALGYPMDQQPYYQAPDQLPQQALFHPVQQAASLNPPGPQPYPQGLPRSNIGNGLHASLNQHTALVYSGLAQAQSASGGLHYPPVPLPMHSAAAALTSPYALQNHNCNHTEVTASTAAICSTPRQPSLGPSTTEPGTVNGQGQPIIEGRHALGASTHIGPHGYGYSIQHDVRPSSDGMASPGHCPDVLTPEPHVEQLLMQADSLLKGADSLSRELDEDFDNAAAEEIFSDIASGPLPVQGAGFSYAGFHSYGYGHSNAGSGIVPTPVPAADPFTLDSPDGNINVGVTEIHSAPGRLLHTVSASAKCCWLAWRCRCSIVLSPLVQLCNTSVTLDSNCKVAAVAQHSTCYTSVPHHELLLLC